MAAVEEAKVRKVFRTVEYLFVDSASTDRTVEIASSYPVTIFRLEPDWPLSAGAGTYTGLHHARGNLVAIVNGDMTIESTWFSNAVPHLTGRVAAVTGVAKEALEGKTPIERLIIRYSLAPVSEGPLPPEVRNHPGGFSSGTIMANASMLKEVGSVNPFFRAAEDHDLRCRLVRAGLEVLDLPLVQGSHFWALDPRGLDLLSYFKTIFRNSVGLGQMARANWRRDSWIARAAIKPCFNARLVINSLLFATWTALIALHLVGVFLWSPALAAALVGDVALGIATADQRRQLRLSFSDSFFAAYVYPIAFTLVRMVGFFRGFSARVRQPSAYPVAQALLSSWS
jgi:glycosyltransferase involved in cell wall biosynthesis